MGLFYYIVFYNLLNMYSEFVIISIVNNYMIDSFFFIKNYNLMGVFYNNENKFVGNFM